MEWILQLISVESVARSVLIFSTVIALGLALGSVKIYGIRLGIAGVLFSGLIFGHFGIKLEHATLDFVREFGLILFVYTIGMQVGPGFLASLKRQGLALNLFAVAIIGLGALITIGLILFGGIETPVAVGLLSGGTTNTPSLAAAQQALKEAAGANEALAKMPGLGYAIAYPFGIIGIILSMLLIRVLFEIDLQQESAALEQLGAESGLETVNLEVQNRNLEGKSIAELHALIEADLVISRVLHQGELHVPQSQTRLAVGDVILAVGASAVLEKARMIIGAESALDLRALPGGITTRRIVLSRKRAMGKTVAELDLARRHGVVITRINRAEIELSCRSDARLHFGDLLTVVGEEDAIQRVAAELGDSPKQLDHPQIIPIFTGIALGVLIGSWPIHLPGVPVPVKLGLAGGPLLAAIVLSWIGSVGRLVWYMPVSANFMLREIGVTLFLACVGLKSGDQFVATLTQGSGLYWLLCGALITFVPLATVGLIARAVYKMNYPLLCGLLAGSMTDPPALAFATSMSNSNAPSISYATVYPLTMILRVICAQLIVLLFRGH